jgi:hypothetical protein
VINSRFCLLELVASCVVFSSAVDAADGDALVRIGAIQVPNTSRTSPLNSFDISLVDARHDLYLLSDSAHKTVDVFRASTGESLFVVPGFFGNAPPGHAHNGPTSLIIVEGDVWAGDNPSKIRIIDLVSQKIKDTISVPGTARVDAMAYDPKDHIVIAANPEEDNGAAPFVSLISTEPEHTILKKISFPNATDWLEAVEWSPSTGLFYLAIPELDHNPGNGGVAVIDPRTRKLVTIFPLNQCRPNGLAMGPNDQMVVGCQGEGLGKKYPFPPHTFILNVKDGKIVATIAGTTGSDEVWYNKGDGFYYLAAEANPGGPALVAIEAVGKHRVMKASTDRSAHSVAADSNTNRLFVPLGPISTDPACQNGCVAIYTIVPNRGH